jgi:hypothetical protein
MQFVTAGISQLPLLAQDANELRKPPSKHFNVLNAPELSRADIEFTQSDTAIIPPQP